MEAAVGEISHMLRFMFSNSGQPTFNPLMQVDETVDPSGIQNQPPPAPNLLSPTDQQTPRSDANSAEQGPSEDSDFANDPMGIGNQK